LAELINDVGIVLEIIGFIIILLVGGRNPGQSYMAMENHKVYAFDIWRKKVIPDPYVYKSLIFGIGLVILGLIMQFSFLFQFR